MASETDLSSRRFGQKARGSGRSFAVGLLVSTVSMFAMNQQALADECRESIIAMFVDGPLDPFARGPHRLTNTVTDADGNFVRRFLTHWQSPSRTASGVEGGNLFALVIEQESWIGPTLDGPWTQTPNSLPDDHDATRQAQHAQEQANLSEPGCIGEVEFNDATYNAYTYLTKTDPNPKMDDAWFGARHTVYIDEETNQVAWWTQTDFVSSFAPEVSGEVHTIRFDYDPDLEIPRP